MRLAFSSVAITCLFAIGTHAFAPASRSTLPLSLVGVLRMGNDDLAGLLDEYKSTVSTGSAASTASSALSSSPSLPSSPSSPTSSDAVVDAVKAVSSSISPNIDSLPDTSTGSSSMDALSNVVDAARNAADTAAAAATAVSSKAIAASKAMAAASAASKATSAGAITTGFGGFQFKKFELETSFDTSSFDDAREKLDNLKSSFLPGGDGSTSLQNIDTTALTTLVDTLHLKQYGGWYAAVAMALAASQQRSAGRQEATSEFESELAQARSKANEAASAAGLAAEGARMAKELAMRMERSSGGDGGKAMLDSSKMKQLQVEKEMLEKEMRSLKDELSTLRKHLQKAEAAKKSDVKVSKTEIEEAYSTKVVMARDPDEDARIVELLKEMDESNKIKQTKAREELDKKREEEAKFVAAAKRKAEKDAEKEAEKKLVEESDAMSRMVEEAQAKAEVANKVRKDTVAKKNATAGKPKSKAKRKAVVKSAPPPPPSVVVSDGDDWNSLTDSALKRKTVAQLSEYLAEKGITVTDDSGKALKKAELLEAVRTL